MKNLILVSTTNVESRTAEEGLITVQYVLELISETTALNSDKTAITFSYILTEKNIKEEKNKETVVTPVMPVHTLIKVITVDLSTLTTPVEASVTKDVKSYKQLFENVVEKIFIEFCNSKSFYGLQWSIKE